MFRLINKINLAFLILLLNLFIISISFDDIFAQKTPYLNNTIDNNNYDIRNESKFIQNEYLLVIEDNSTLFSEEIENNLENVNTPSKNYNITDYANFSTVYMKLPDKVVEGGPAGVMNLTRNLTIGDVETIFNFTVSGPASSGAIPANNSLEICTLINNNRPEVTSCEPNTILPPPASVQTIPTGISRIGGNGLTSIQTNFGLAPFTIAVIDTGINPVSDLNLIGSTSFEGDVKDNYKHGTHVAGIIAAKNNDFGIIGVAPNAKLYSLKVYDTTSNPGDVNDFNSAFQHILDHPELAIKIINISYDIARKSPYLEQATKRLVAEGITIVAAAGNAKRDASLAWPGGDPNVISVAAITDNNGRCGGNGGIVTVTNPNGNIIGQDNDDSFADDYSNWGPAVDLAAPGSNILSTWPDNTFKSDSGTSMASPYVAGAAALVKFANPQSSPQAIKNILLSHATLPPVNCDGDGRGYFTGKGMGEPTTTIPIPLLYIKNLIG